MTPHRKRAVASMGLIGAAAIWLLLPTVFGQTQEVPVVAQDDAKEKLDHARAEVKRLQDDVHKRQRELLKNMHDLQTAMQHLQKTQRETDRSGAVVAYLYDGQVSISRAELGDYLISRVGPARLESMINRKILEIECRKLKIAVTDREVEERCQQDLKGFGPLTEEDFEKHVLQRFGRTLFEWKEDVVRPKLMLEKLVRPTIKITADDDVRQAFTARYGPKVECRMIVCADRNAATRVWENARAGREQFLDEARKQFTPGLAAVAGTVPPIHKFFDDKQIEEFAFGLKEGEVSKLVSMKDGTYVLLLCEKHVPADNAVKLEDVQQELSREIIERRLAKKLPEVLEDMRKRATPRLVPVEQP